METALPRKIAWPRDLYLLREYKLPRPEAVYVPEVVSFFSLDSLIIMVVSSEVVKVVLEADSEGVGEYPQDIYISCYNNRPDPNPRVSRQWESRKEETL
jgi:hypothetical protein